MSASDTYKVTDNGMTHHVVSSRVIVDGPLRNSAPCACNAAAICSAVSPRSCLDRISALRASCCSLPEVNVSTFQGRTGVPCARTFLQMTLTAWSVLSKISCGWELQVQCQLISQRRPLLDCLQVRPFVFGSARFRMPQDTR